MQYDVIFAYLRLSRDDKEKIEESNSIKNQKLLIQHFVDNQPEFAGARLLFFADDGYSGTTFERPEFQRMIADSRYKTFQAARRLNARSFSECWD